MTDMLKPAEGPWYEAREVVEGQGAAAILEAISGAARDHVAWHESGLSLVAARNLLSPRARELMASGLMERVTGGGWIAERRKSGQAMIDRIEAILVELARRLFRVCAVEFRIPTGSISNAVFLFAATEPGETVVALPPKYGGHATYGRPGYATAHALEIADLPCRGAAVPEIDLEELAKCAERLCPSWIIVGSSWPLFPYPLAEIRRIADRVGARILYDGAHVLGLIAGGRFQDPIREGAAAITSSTQKTFPGPVGGLILTDDADLGETIRAFTSRAIGNYHNNRAAALAVTLAEMIEFAEAYAEATISNAKAFAAALDEAGFTVAGKARGFTESHVVLLDLAEVMDPEEAWKRLEAARITCEAIALPYSYPRPVALRLGSLSLTRRGMGAPEMAAVAGYFRRVILEREDPARVEPDVLALSAGFTKVRYCI